MNRQSYPRQSKCEVKTCRTEYTKLRMGHDWCSIPCAVTLGMDRLEKRQRKEQREREEAAKRDRAEIRRRKEMLEPLEYWLKKAERACNAYIRKRDEGQGCISCGRHNAEVWNAGHFHSVGARRDLRFNEDNIHLQCARPCNKDKGGNIHEYQKALLKKIGPERLAALDVHQPVEKMTREKAQEIERYFKAKLAELKREAA